MISTPSTRTLTSGIITKAARLKPAKTKTSPFTSPFLTTRKPAPQTADEAKTGHHETARRTLAEHPFGVLIHRAGMNHFLMRVLGKCRGEFSLMAWDYNFTRILNILGVDALRDYCVRRPGNEICVKKTNFGAV